MPVTGFIESAFSSDQRQEGRQTLRLILTASSPGASGRLAVVHNISPTGFLLESASDLESGDTLEVTLPHAGATHAAVVWRSGQLYGCRFDTPISAATLSAARLRGAVQRDIAPVPLPAAIETLGARLARLRAAAKLTQAEVAAHLRVSEASVSAWEQDKSRPKAGRIEALAELLGIASSELLGLAPSRSLESAVSRAKAEIAAAVNTSPENVQITILL